MFYIVNEDKPGFIGKLGTMLGDAKVNIANFTLGRSAPGQDAIALIEVDGPVPAAGGGSRRQAAASQTRKAFSVLGGVLDSSAAFRGATLSIRQLSSPSRRSR